MKKHSINKLKRVFLASALLFIAFNNVNAAQSKELDTTNLIAVNSEDAKTNKFLKEVADTMNKSCPMTIDESTRLDNVTTLPSRTLQYNYTLVNNVKDELDIDTIKDYLKTNILNQIKTNPQLKIFRDKKVNLNYSYSDKTGVFLFLLEFKAKDYTKK